MNNISSDKNPTSSPDMDAAAIKELDLYKLIYGNEAANALLERARIMAAENAITPKILFAAGDALAEESQSLPYQPPQRRESNIVITSEPRSFAQIARERAEKAKASGEMTP